MKHFLVRILVLLSAVVGPRLALADTVRAPDSAPSAAFYREVATTGGGSIDLVDMTNNPHVKVFWVVVINTSTTESVLLTAGSDDRKFEDNHISWLMNGAPFIGQPHDSTTPPLIDPVRVAPEETMVLPVNARYLAILNNGAAATLRIVAVM